MPGINRKKGWRQVEQGFSSSFAKFFPHLMIFQRSTETILKNINYGKNSGEK